MPVSNYHKYFEANKRYLDKTREKRNALKRAQRLKARKQKLANKHCLNCDILLAERLEDKGRSYLYCRKCLIEHKDEVLSHKYSRYWAKLPKEVKTRRIVKEAARPLPSPIRKNKSKSNYIVSWRTLKSK